MIVFAFSLIPLLGALIYALSYFRVRFLKARIRVIDHKSLALLKQGDILKKGRFLDPKWTDFALVAVFWAMFWGGIGVAVCFFLSVALWKTLILASLLSIAGAGQYLLFYLDVNSNPRDDVESFILIFMGICAGVASFVTLGIIFSLVLEALHFFTLYSFFDFITGTHWSPQQANMTTGSKPFGFVPLITGSLVITVIAMMIAVPMGLWSAIYLSEYASRSHRVILKPILEILAGIPSVVFGFFAALTVAPFVQKVGMSLGLDVASESALAAGIVIGVMIVPYISSLSDDVISAVPHALRDGSYALGATKAETIQRVLIPAALPGILSSFLLAFSRAIGETMVVVMAAGLSANMTLNPLQSMTTVTVQIASLLVGDQEFNNPKTLVAFALGIVLFVMTLIFNMIASRVIYIYRKRYEAL
jgi:phosphate transport system permease protein